MTYKEIVSGVYNVGCIDTLEREFHVHEIGRGTSYNSYVIKDEKITIVDTVKATFACQFINNIKACLAGKIGATADDEILKQIQIIYVLHTEPDHNGSLRHLYNLCPNAEIVCGKMCRANILRWFPESKDWRIRAISNGEAVKLGANTMELIETPLLHWNDSTFGYLREKKLLFSSDCFGQHIGDNMTTDADIGEDDLLVQMKVYYAQVFSQITPPTLKMVRDVERVTTGKVSELVKDAEWRSPFDASGLHGILPAHGLCLMRKSTIERSVRLYRRWAEQVPVRKIVILYESIYDTTAKMAHELKQRLEELVAEYMDQQRKERAEKGDKEEAPVATPLAVELMCARRNTILDVVHEVMDAPVVLFGSATFNNAILPNMMKMLHTIRTYHWKPKATLCFGSFGWSPVAMKELEQIVVEQIKGSPIVPTISCCNEMDAASVAKLREAAEIAFKEAMTRGLPGGCLAL